MIWRDHPAPHTAPRACTRGSPGLGGNCTDLASVGCAALVWLHAVLRCFCMHSGGELHPGRKRAPHCCPQMCPPLGRLAHDPQVRCKTELTHPAARPLAHKLRPPATPRPFRIARRARRRALQQTPHFASLYVYPCINTPAAPACAMPHSPQLTPLQCGGPRVSGTLTYTPREMTPLCYVTPRARQQRAAPSNPPVPPVLCDPTRAPDTAGGAQHSPLSTSPHQTTAYRRRQRHHPASPLECTYVYRVERPPACGGQHHTRLHTPPHHHTAPQCKAS